MVNIHVNKNILVIYYKVNKYLEMFSSNNKLTKFVYDTSRTIFPSSVILFVFLILWKYVQFLEIIE